ncbi:SLC13 family permease [uncultured Draconibacterium sp.]|uniref:SLC13 family permease n=1 Tax=uncultured Draconibacterium sp. TaxID=1573823 RepID=UPI002AA8E618|nr:SLC13 family permease [uncultured Draconibacterium sp.]
MMQKIIKKDYKVIGTRQITLFLFPTLAALLIIFNPLNIDQQVVKMLAVILLVAGWWVFESLPLPVTSLLPVFLFPLLGIMDGKMVAVQYFNDIIFLYVGGFIISLALERWNLHKRIAYKTLLFFGSSHIRILFGFMIASSFLSMWMSNTATAMLMLPIAISVLSELERLQGHKQIAKYKIGLLLGIAYACSIGGITTLIGTPPNLVFSALFRELYQGQQEISFSQWLMFSFPIYFVMIFLSTIVLYLLHKPEKNTDEVPRHYIRNEYEKLGKINYEQKVLAVVFFLFAFALIFKNNIEIGNFTIPGWSSLFPYSSFIKDGNIAVAIAFLLYLIPSRSDRNEKMMDWKTTLKLPWGIILLFGGGSALAKGAVTSGFSSWIGDIITNNAGNNSVAIVSASTAAMAFLTEFTSNVSTAQILLPVMSSIADKLLLPPLLLMIPVTIASSLAFMMPVATPPNAIVFGSGFISVKNMILPGLIMNILGIIIVLTVTIFWGTYVFNF